MGCLLGCPETRGLGGPGRGGGEGDEVQTVQREHRPNDSGCPDLCPH